jgi:hypothetical protein
LRPPRPPWNLAAKNNDNKVSIARVGGIAAIVQATKTHFQVANVQEEACGALRNLSYNDNLAQQLNMQARKWLEASRKQSLCCGFVEDFPSLGIVWGISACNLVETFLRHCLS